MPAYIRKLTPRGLQSVEYEAESLHAAARYEPLDGVYTVTNTYNVTQVLKFDAHLDRLEDSARRANIDLKLDRQHLRSALRTMILDADYGDVRFRITVDRATPDEFILTLETYTPPAISLIEDGVRVITSANSARQNAAAKTTGWMHNRLEITLPDGIYDAILLDAEGYMLEGLAANFYAVLDGALHTAGEGVLPGISRLIVFEVAPAILPLVTTAPHIHDLPKITEAFITSSSRGVIPIIEIDGQTLGDGTPGVKTKAIRAAYEQWVQTHLEEL